MSHRLLLRPRLAGLAAAAALLVALASCGGNAGGTGAPTSPTGGAGGTASGDPASSGSVAATDAGGSSDAAARYTTPLAGVCPKTVVLQWNWWPQPEQAWSYQLIGDAGTADTQHYTYTGPLGSTGVNLEIRSGGPATAGQLPVAQMYSDDSILLGVTTTEDSVGDAADFPTVSVFTYAQKTPLVFFWGNPDWNFKNLTDIKNSGQTVLAFDGSPFLGVLEGQGLLDPAQVDQSYDGDPGRFIVDDGNVIEQGFLTSEVYRYQHDIPQWDKPVKYVLVGDEYHAYHSQVSIRADKLEANRACLSKLVPLLQQAAVDYAHDPGPTNAVLLDYVSKLAGTGWTLSKGITEWADSQSLKAGIVANGTDGTFGSFDMNRVSAFISAVTPVFQAQGKKVPADLKPQDIVTNEFLDPSISL
jgi:hypothetical protein